MRLSTKVRYGLRILLQIALDNQNGKLAQGRSIAKKQEISEPYLEQIMIPLKNSGMVRTVRGCRGGYRLNREPDSITVLDVIELFEGDIKLVECVSENGTCPRFKGCPTTGIWKKLSENLKEDAGRINLSSIIEEHKKIALPDYMI